ncbi:MAG TPA: DUF2177 family protein [Bacteroidia bacterium]|jgi:uncharacterized membrane protein|nr:DUF2177 family protein [Bacteroidia bacterium]
MLKLISTYFIALITFFAIDMVWLGVVSKNYYKQKLGFILSPNPNWAAAIFFYLIYIGGILFFAINPGLKEMNWQTALINGVVFGAMCYTTYDLTNMATIAKWPIEIVIIDIIWGMVITGSVSVITYFAVSKIF